MSNETYSLTIYEKPHMCAICGKETNKMLDAVNDSGGTQIFICDECGYDIINRLVQDADFRKTASEKSY